MPTLDPFRFLLIAFGGWMNQRQLQMIEYRLGGMLNYYHRAAA
jgi:hypothetical protein